MTTSATTPEILLRRSRLKLLLRSAVGIFFTAAGIWLIRVSNHWSGWGLVLLFGLLCPLSLADLVMGRSRLQVTTDGFTVYTLFHTRHYRWQDVCDFHVVTVYTNGIPSQRFVSFSYVDPQKVSAATRGLAEVMGMGHCNLPDTYGLKADRLATLMNECCQLARPSASAANLNDAAP